MRKKKFFVSLVIILVFCMVMTACGGENKPGQNGQPDTVEVHEGEEQDTTDQINPDAHDPFRDRDDQGNPIDHAAESEAHDGQYAYKVGDTTIYTEHDLEQWIYLDDRFTTESYTLDLDAMLIDLWCAGNRGGIFVNDVGYSYVIDGENTKGLWFDSPDPERSKLYHAVTVWYSVNGSEQTTTVRMYDCDSSDPPHDYLRVMSTYAIHREVAPLILYSIEQMEIDPSSGALNDLDLGRNFYCD